MTALTRARASAQQAAQPPSELSGSMTLDELAVWAAGQADGLAAKFGLQSDGETFLSRQCIKLGEEAGELQGAVLAFLNYQREHKINDFTTEGLGAEVADVMICAAILAARTGVDLGSALTQKIEKVSRFV
jgi:NTP pyrophosphatase (non-canonical NTP hydrolase)